MKTILWALAFLLVAATASAKIQISDLTVLESIVSDSVTVGNITAAIANQLAEESIMVTFCITDHNGEEYCCSYIKGQANYTFNVYQAPNDELESTP